MRKTIIIVLFSFLALLILASCNNNPEPEKWVYKDSDETWTLIIKGNGKVELTMEKVFPDHPAGQNDKNYAQLLGEYQANSEAEGTIVFSSIIARAIYVKEDGTEWFSPYSTDGWEPQTVQIVIKDNELKMITTHLDIVVMIDGGSHTYTFTKK